jgi:hypothetical protein
VTASQPLPQQGEDRDALAEQMAQALWTAHGYVKEWQDTTGASALDYWRKMAVSALAQRVSPSPSGDRGADEALSVEWAVRRPDGFVVASDEQEARNYVAQGNADGSDRYTLMQRAVSAWQPAPSPVVGLENGETR